MNNYDASDLECASVRCAVCENSIRGGKWFSRIKHGQWVVALCCPLCTETFVSNPHSYIRRIETLEFMEAQDSLKQRGFPLNG
jgi:hypothetical protein